MKDTTTLMTSPSRRVDSVSCPTKSSTLEPKQDSSIQIGIASMIFILISTTLLHLSYKWYVQLSKIKQVENDQLHLELSSLKNQINPHFFFNTLNNLYALLVLKPNSPLKPSPE